MHKIVEQEVLKRHPVGMRALPALMTVGPYERRAAVEAVLGMPVAVRIAFWKLHGRCNGAGFPESEFHLEESFFGLSKIQLVT